jgi:hypothetical protein
VRVSWPWIDLRSGAVRRRPSSIGFRGSRGRRRPASEPAPLTTPRIFVSSRRRRHAVPVTLVVIVLWATALGAMAAGIVE